MEKITKFDIIESNCLKKETCNNIKESLKGRLSDEKIEIFEKIFNSASDRYLFKKKEP